MLTALLLSALVVAPILLLLSSPRSVSAGPPVTPMVAAGLQQTVGLRTNGTVVAVGNNWAHQCDVDSWTDIKQVATDHLHTVGLKSDGTVVATGYNQFGQCDVGSWNDIQQVAVGAHYTVGLRTDETVVTAGAKGVPDYDIGQFNVGGWTDIKQVAAGGGHTVGLRRNGRVMATGLNNHGQCNVDSWTGIRQVATGFNHTVGLREDGTVVAVGWNFYGECDIGSWTGIVQVAAGDGITVGLKSDRTVVAAPTGPYRHGQCLVDSWTNIQQVAAGESHTVGLRTDGTVVAVGNPSDGQCNVGDWNLGTAIFSAKTSMINRLEGFGLNESSSRALLDSLRTEYSGASDQRKQEIVRQVERMISGEVLAEVASGRGQTLSYSVGRSVVGATWAALVAPDLAELALATGSMMTLPQRIALQLMKKTAEAKLRLIAEVSGLDLTTAIEFKNRCLDTLILMYEVPDLALQKLQQFREECSETVASGYYGAYLNNGGVKILIPVAPGFVLSVGSPTIKEGVDKLDHLIALGEIGGTSDEAREMAEGVYVPLMETTAGAVEEISDDVYYLADLGFIDDVTKAILTETVGGNVATIIKNMADVLEESSKIAKVASKVIYVVEVGGKSLSTGFGSSGMGILGYENKLGQVHIADPSALIPSPLELIKDPPGSDLEIAANIATARQSLQGLLDALDLLDESLASGDLMDIEARTAEYFGAGGLAIEDTCDAASAYLDVTSICTSAEDYYQKRADILGATIDLQTEVVSQCSALCGYLEDTHNTTALAELRTQIDTTANSAFAVADALSGAETTISLFIPSVTKTVSVEDGMDTTASVEFMVCNTGTSDATDVSVDMVLPEGVTSSQTTWQVGEMGQGDSATLHADITFSRSSDFMIHLKAFDGVDHNAYNVIYVDLVDIDTCDSEENPREQFAVGESVYVKGNGLEPNTDYLVWIQDDGVAEGDALVPGEDPSGEQDLVTTDENGNFGPVKIWDIPADAAVSYHQYDIVLDKQDDGENTGKCNSASDGMDSMAAVGFTAPVPELATLLLFGTGLFMLGGLVLWTRRRAAA